jgi:hypothetical protein
MENEIRKSINQVKNVGEKLNENIETEPRTVKEVVAVLNKYGIKVSDKENYYSMGDGYGEKYTIIGSDDVDGRTSYGYIPIKVKSQGFNTKKGILQNYFFHNGDGFELTRKISEFLKMLGK